MQVIDSRFDALPDPATSAIINNYKPTMDTLMGVVIGQAAQELTVELPESLLSNFTADALLRIAEQQRIAIDCSLYNFGGLRTSLPKGPVRLYEMFLIYSFDNDLVVITIEGKYIRELGDFFARTQPQPMGNVELVIAGKQLKSMRIKGKEVEDKQLYRVITNDFVASGGDDMKVLTNALVIERPGILVRDAMIAYIQSLTAKGKQVDAKLNERVKYE